MVSFSTPTFLSRKTATSLLKSSSSTVSFAILSLCSFEEDWGSLKPANNFRCFGSLPRKRFIYITTASPGSKYEHRRTSALLRHIRNIRICIGKNLSFPSPAKMKGFQLKKNSLPCIKCVLRRSGAGPWADLWPFYALYCKRCSFWRCSYFELGLPVILRDLLEWNRVEHL